MLYQSKKMLYIYSTAATIYIMVFFQRIKACFKRLQALETKSINDDSVVLHNYVEMAEKPNKATYTISYA